MDLKDLIARQLEQDEAHGFKWRFDNEAERYSQITKDLVGLMGEIGELANLVKKINIKIERQEGYELDVSAAQKETHEELADSFIYLIRLAVMLNADLETEVINKIKYNKRRYAKLRK